MPLAEASPTTANPPSEPPFQFGIRWLLLAMMLISVFLAVWIWSPEWAVYGGGLLAIPSLFFLARCYPRWAEVHVVAGIMIILVLLLLPAMSAVVSGYRMLPVIFHVRHQQTAEPIEGATVEMAWLGQQQPVGGTTDSAGSIEIVAEFDTAAFSTAFGSTRWAYPDCRHLSVRADGYKEVRKELVALGAKRWDYTHRTLQVVVYLEPVR